MSFVNLVQAGPGVADNKLANDVRRQARQTRADCSARIVISPRGRGREPPVEERLGLRKAGDRRPCLRWSRGHGRRGPLAGGSAALRPRPPVAERGARRRPSCERAGSSIAPRPRSELAPLCAGDFLPALPEHEKQLREGAEWKGVSGRPPNVPQLGVAEYALTWFLFADDRGGHASRDWRRRHAVAVTEDGPAKKTRKIGQQVVRDIRGTAPRQRPSRLAGQCRVGQFR